MHYPIQRGPDLLCPYLTSRGSHLSSWTYPPHHVVEEEELLLGHEPSVLLVMDMFCVSSLPLSHPRRIESAAKKYF